MVRRFGWWMVAAGCAGAPDAEAPPVPEDEVPVVIVGARSGDPELASADRLTFGPHGALVIGDGDADRLFVVDTGERSPSDAAEFGSITSVARKAAKALGVDEADVRVTDFAVNPASGRAWVAVERQDVAWAGVLAVNADRSLEWIDLAALPWVEVPYGEVDGPGSTVTDLEWTEAWLVAAVLEGGWSASRVVSLPVPVADGAETTMTSTNTYHRTHGAWETIAPITTMFSWDAYVGASYACAPVVRFDVDALTAGEPETVGTTPFDFGGGRQVLDMAVIGEGDDQEILANVWGLGGVRIGVDVFAREGRVDEQAEIVFDRAGEPVISEAHRAPKLDEALRIEVLDTERVVLFDGEGLKTVDRPR